jgi:cyanophycinase
MSGTLALVGSGEFLDTMRSTDALLLEKVGGAGSARVVVLPTASTPDGPAVFGRWAAMGRAHFAALGASVDVATLATREDANDSATVEQILAANVVYLSGGKPGYLLRTLRGTPAWAAIEQVYARGGVLAGCSAGAMVLGGALLTPRLRLGRPWLFADAFGLVPGSVILPHYDAMPAWISALVRRSLPPSLTLLGIDEHTALISDGGGWQVHGRAGVEVSYAGKQQRYHSGERVVL